MNDPSITTPDTRPPHSGAVIAHGLAALAAHIVDHHLPAPHSVDLPSRFADDFDGLTVTIPSHAVASWTGDGFAADDLAVDASPAVMPSYRWVRVDGRLGDTGVRVRVRWITSAPIVSAVPA